MKKTEIIRIIESFAPLQLAEPWDCSGWLVETNNITVNKVLFCLTVTADIIAQAKSQNCDMIISHHPLFFIPFEYCGIDIYCAHTNLDRTQGGTTDTLVEVLDMPISQIGQDGFVRYSKCDITINELKDKLCQISQNVRLVNNKNVTKFKKVAFCAGSGSEFIKDVIENDADVFVTGDLKFHTALDCEIVLFDIGHFESEIVVLKVLANLFKKNLEIIFADEKSPFTTVNKN